jgi:hypothetical protein
VGFVVIIVRVSEGLVDVGVGGDAGNQLGGASGSGRLQVEVLDGQTFGCFGLVAEGLGDELVNGVDALDDEVALIGSATNDPDVLNVREFVFAAGTVDQIAVKSRVGVVLVVRQDAALVEVAVLDDLVDGEVGLTELGGGQKLGLSLNSFSGQTADGVPGIALARDGSLNGVVSGVLSVVVVVFVLVEDTRAAVKLNLDLGSDGALEVDNPQGRLLADGDVLNLARDDLDLEGLLEVLLIDDADLLSGVDGAELVHNIFVELLGLGAQESNVQGAFIDGLNDELTLDGTTGNLGANANDTSRSPTGVVVFVGVSGHPD